ncbi:MAG: hypothetical protein LBD13_01530, partial [Spirochaetaceae bacterium]|nr:hypothetical protein [Spirochaetaceae bacterium]
FLDYRKTFLDYKKLFLDCKKLFLDCKKLFLDCKKTFLDYKKTFLDYKKTFLGYKKTGFSAAFCWYIKKIIGAFAPLLRDVEGHRPSTPPLKASCAAPVRYLSAMRRRFGVVTKRANPLAARST